MNLIPLMKYHNSMERFVVILWAICVGMVVVVVVVKGEASRWSFNATLAGDVEALLNLRKAVGGRLHGWNANASVCKWKGVMCGGTGTGTGTGTGSGELRVVSLSLPAAGLSGTIPPGILGNLTSLRKLRLRFNALRGPLPPDLSNCPNLRTLYLQGNHFSGSLPWNFSLWPHLTRLNLASNNLSGPLPHSLQTLQHLGTLFLHNNSFTGSFPPIDASKLVQFNVSYNNLSGPLPHSLLKFYPSGFIGNQNICGRCSKKEKEKKHGWAVIVVGIAVAVALVCTMIAAVVVIWRKKRRGGDVKGRGRGSEAEKESPSEMDSSFTKEEYSISLQEPERVKNKLIFVPERSMSNGGGGGGAFSLEDLLRASAELLGRGSVGSSYKAVLETGNVVVVKRMRDTRTPTPIIHALSNISHPNLLPLKAYYFSHHDNLLVYDYLPYGSLASLLHGKRRGRGSPVDWCKRVHLALGTAKGIEYLHKQGRKMCHGNIKSSNVLIREEYEACVCDYGLGEREQRRKGGGYVAPEGRVSKEGDVYSYGVLLLELLTGKKSGEEEEEGMDLPKWVESVVREEWTGEVFDMELVHDCPCPCPHEQEDEMLHLLQLGMACVAHFPDQRPTMSQVVKMIGDISSRALPSPSPSPTPIH